MEISHSGIGEKVCRTKNGHSTQTTKTSYGTYAPATDRSAESKTETALCGVRVVQVEQTEQRNRYLRTL
ncbi:putative p44 protein [Anaplasma phagocytophilum str. ApMUC09]|uniref:Putative p44 protein n=1 Tax=Anaplasma phagocytophilum str. ApMUC09 TaxID=1359152 RepID=A0A0F3N9V8_ANAPH|nr:putative p44 protein [Anaplasma phagocytophilum str. ApMUC09]